MTTDTRSDIRMTGPPIALETGRLLDTITDPNDVRRLAADDLPRLAQEIRTELVERVTERGGHLGPNLGVVELSIALHRVFRSPHDALVWDTGHQAYVHKMLTGRVPGFTRLRQRGGLSGYPNRSESVHDIVENSHASTALSYADGLAKGFALAGTPERRIVAVVGDGALTGGMAWEALNNIGAAPERPVVVVLNDNGRSYDPTAGRLPRHLAELREHTAAGNLFEALGFVYLGPVDGHDVGMVERALRAARVVRHPVVVHVVTRKGEGYPPAEHDEADRFHTVSPAGAGSAPPGWTSVFGAELERLGDERSDLVAVTAAMMRPTGLYPFGRRFPDRVFDVGIAEQHAVTSAVGLATAGMHPVVAIYATFLNRAFDQVLMDASLHRAPITFVLDRAGITGPDGASHHGIWDLGLFGLVPGARVAAPRDGERLCDLLRECVDYDGPSVLRFPRGSCPPCVEAVGRWGSADVLREGSADDVLVLAVGPLAGCALEAANRLEGEGLDVTVVDPRWVLPIDPELAANAAAYRLVITVEDAAPSGGFGDQVSRALRALAGLDAPRLRGLALPDGQFLPAGTRAELLSAAGLDADGIIAAVLSR
ncbi:MAG TPA: 1-deoxy-D-xylulose-5-phosphate synthase [Nocardioides sp.]|nr:1-deoxy-D-xylulose-5-phosphate synthase [Nocardioides sp.]